MTQLTKETQKNGDDDGRWWNKTEDHPRKTGGSLGLSKRMHGLEIMEKENQGATG